MDMGAAKAPTIRGAKNAGAVHTPNQTPTWRHANRLVWSALLPNPALGHFLLRGVRNNVSDVVVGAPREKWNNSTRPTCRLLPNEADSTSETAHLALRSRRTSSSGMVSPMLPTTESTAASAPRRSSALQISSIISPWSALDLLVRRSGSFTTLAAMRLALS
jgi:hypothetical protein